MSLNIIVCIKSVPETAEADLEIAGDGSALDTDEIVFSINEWDNYAVEEAVRLKEKQGGTITVITVGDDEAEAALRRALAMGADEAIHCNDEAFERSDPATVATILTKTIEELDDEPTLILTGAQSADLGQGQTGVLLAQKLGLPWATLAVALDIDEETLTVTRELEANTQEQVSLSLPALVTVQSGINQPRYVSIMGIRKVRSKTIEEKEPDDLDLDEDELGFENSIFESRRLTPPIAGGAAEMLEGSLPEVCASAAQIIREKGGLQ